MSVGLLQHCHQGGFVFGVHAAGDAVFVDVTATGSRMTALARVTPARIGRIVATAGTLEIASVAHKTSVVSN